MPRYQSLRPLALILFAVVGSACSNPHKQVVGTDIPLVPELNHTSTTVTAGSKTQIAEGTVTFQGPVYDALERARWSVANFNHTGWELKGITGTPEKATATFFNRKIQNGIQRVATLVVTADRRDGSAVINFSTRPVPPDSTTPPEDSKTGSPAKS